jgi:hypothetical protein
VKEPRITPPDFGIAPKNASKDRVKLRRRRALSLSVVVIAVAEILERIVGRSGLLKNHPVLQIVVGVVVVIALGVAAHDATAALRRRRRDRAERAVTGRWPTGSPYVAAIQAAAHAPRVPANLVFQDAGLRVDPAPDPVPDVIPFADVTTVRVHSPSVEIETRLWTFRVFTSSYDDRQRLLWELALRCNAAMERGLDETAPAAPPGAPASAERTAAHADEFGGGVAGIGSALAPPPKTSTPAPPRKSGLGVGLFPLPPRDEAAPANGSGGD